MDGFNRIECDIKRNGLIFFSFAQRHRYTHTHAHIIIFTTLALSLLCCHVIRYTHAMIDTRFSALFTLDSISFALYTQSIVTLDERIPEEHSAQKTRAHTPFAQAYFDVNQMKAKNTQTMNETEVLKYNFNLHISIHYMFALIQIVYQIEQIKRSERKTAKKR